MYTYEYSRLLTAQTKPLFKSVYGRGKVGVTRVSSTSSELSETSALDDFKTIKKSRLKDSAAKIDVSAEGGRCAVCGVRRRGGTLPTRYKSLEMIKHKPALKKRKRRGDKLVKLTRCELGQDTRDPTVAPLSDNTHDRLRPIFCSSVLSRYRTRAPTTFTERRLSFRDIVRVQWKTNTTESTNFRTLNEGETRAGAG